MFFPVIFHKKISFLFSFLYTNPILKWGLSKRKEFLHTRGAESVLLEQNIFERVASPESVYLLTCLYMYFYYFMDVDIHI